MNKGLELKRWVCVLSRMIRSESYVHKPLIAVRRLVEKGNRVVFVPVLEENDIQNVKSGKKVHMRTKNSGSYVFGY